MPPAFVHQILLQSLAVLAAAGLVLGLRGGTGRAVISHRGRLLPVVIASVICAITFSISLEDHALWIEVPAYVAFAAAFGVMVHLSTRWDSFLSMLAQSAATWSTFGVFILAQDFAHSYATGGAFWQPWNSLVCALQVGGALFFAAIQATAIRGARTRARRPMPAASVAVAQRDGLGALRSLEAH